MWALFLLLPPRHIGRHAGPGADRGPGCTGAPAPSETPVDSPWDDGTPSWRTASARWHYAHSTGLSGKWAVVSDEHSSPLDFPLTHNGQSKYEFSNQVNNINVL